MSKTIIAASGDYWLLTYRGDDHYRDYDKEQVIAWAIDPDPQRGFSDPWDSFIRVTPITSKGEPEQDNFNWAILHPDGIVTRSDGMTEPCRLEQWLDFRRKVAERKAERERKAKEQATATAEVAPTAI